MKKTRAFTIYNVICAVVLIVMFLVCVYPIVWMILGSFKGNGEFYTNIWGLPKSFGFDNYITAWRDGQMARRFINSLIVTIGSMCVLIPATTCAAYAVARLNFKGKHLIYAYLLLGIMIPAGVLGIPTFTVAMKLKLLNSHFGLMLVYAAQNIAMGMFIMRGFFLSLPKELEEAALIDGCSRFGCFVRIILPLAKAGVATQVIFNGLTIWNDYYMANIMITRDELRTLPLSVATFVGRHTTDYPQLFAMLTMATLPIIIIFILSQRSFIEGVAAGAVKG
jgi:ABC-type glycerol-3-phosphate transport system permease component